MTTRAVCVTGMHRSGTSLAMRAVQLLGVSLGDPDRLMPPGRDNPAGYWENRDIKELDDELLAHLGGAWDQPPVLDPGWEEHPGLEPFRDRARAILTTAFGAGTGSEETIGWKDPRLSVLLPFWRTVTPITTTIVVVRDPAAVSASLLSRNKIDWPQSSVLWLRSLFAAAEHDPGHLLVRQQDFFDDLDRVLVTIARHAALPAPSGEQIAAVRAHLDPGLQHHSERGGRHAPSTNALVAMARSVWNDGDVDLHAVDEHTRRALARGWLRPPQDGEALTRARAQVVELRELVRLRGRQLAQLSTASAPEPAAKGSP